jgi:hypothetical protein
MKPKTVAGSREVADEIRDSGDAAVSEDAAAQRRIATLAPFRWRAGQSGNPGGRLGRFAERARRATQNGEDLIAFWVRVMSDPGERTRDRLAAASELAARGWGRPPAFLAVQRCDQQQEKPSPLTEGIRRLSVEEARQLLGLLRVAMDKPALPAPGPRA